MGLMPKLKFKIDSSLSKERVLAQLKEITRSEQKTSMIRAYYRYSELFYGEIGSNSFRISPVVFYSSFVPVIYGEVYGNSQGSTIKIKTNISKYVLAFLICIIVFLGFFFLIPLIVDIHKGIGIRLIHFIPIIWFLISYVFIFFGYLLESLIAKKRLEKYLSFPRT
jgi:hypothetical protein